ncbi:hypothetical protein HZU77_009645 [Neisseriaceae bacterium TC5R-5]|nr:hypothetical protein [Neisseriaceae bacterium TC5R-5]
MRDIANFNFTEWLSLLPLSDGITQLRNDIWQKWYCYQRTKQQDSLLATLSGSEHLALVVAFEQPWALDWQLRMAQLHLPGVRWVVFDNSRRLELRRQIAAVCDRNAVPYLALPLNLTRHVNRSHGMAMSWIYKNVIEYIQPRSFAFIDHDMIPVLPNHYPEQLLTQPLYGLPNSSPWAWHLWAGYCAFNFDFTRNKKLNFLYDFSNGLDTGGRNWPAIYSTVDRTQLHLAERVFLEVAAPERQSRPLVEIIDETWFHIGSISYNNIFQQKSALCAYLARSLDEGASWLDLCPDLATRLAS